MMKISFFLGCKLMMFSVVLFCYSLEFFFLSKILFFEWEFFTFQNMCMVMTLIVDWMSLSFSGLVMFISSCVLFYSTVYMNSEKFFFRFIIIVYLFVLSMIFLIYSPNMISLLLGWDGLGLVSYCLVIYYQNIKSANAGMVTILSNRIGDVAILLSIAWMFNYGGWNFFYLQFMWTSNELIFIFILITIAAMTKSAQMPFSAWLPAAMAAPTPVSALVHSSTLVTAGVYILIRFSTMIGVSNFLLYLGVLTMFMAGLSANFECDLKKIIALSTLSQLGLMMMVIGVGLKDLSFFHLLTHAMFKSLLFLCAGMFIHSYGEIQDIRFMSSLLKGLPVSSFYFIICSMALCGAPFLSGFYSKDLILEMFMMSNMNFMFFMISILATIFTLSYSIRLSWLIFMGAGSKKNLMLEEDLGSILPMSFLIFLSIFAGGWLSFFLIPSYMIFLPFMFKMCVFFFLGAIFLIYFNMLKLNLMHENKYYKKIFYYISSMWFLPYLTSFLFFPALKSGLFFLKFMDQGWTELVGGRGLEKFISRGATNLGLLNYINMKYYLVSFLFIFFMMGLLI